MPIFHFLLALLVVTIWGMNFIFVKVCLDEVSPLFLCTLRFILSSIPIIFFIKPPAIAPSKVVWYGLITFAIQFSLVFMGMRLGMTPGMASLLMQVQVVFSLLFAVLFLGESVSIWQISGSVIAFLGIGVVGLHVDHNVSLIGFLLLLIAAAAWGYSNFMTRQLNRINMMALIVWGSFASIFPMLGLTLLFEGWGSMVQGYHNLTGPGLGSLLYIAYVSTLAGYGIWNWLLRHHRVSTVIPFTLLIPIVGMVSSIVLLGEPCPLWKLVAMLLVVGGLCVDWGGERFFGRVMPRFGKLNRVEVVMEQPGLD